jgi:hypothetical protein
MPQADKTVVSSSRVVVVFLFTQHFIHSRPRTLAWLNAILPATISGIHSYACSLVHSELSWWELCGSLHLHVAHTCPLLQSLQRYINRSVRYRH